MSEGTLPGTTERTARRSAPTSITGVGAVTGYGWGRKHVWDGFLLGESATTEALAKIAPGVTPEMAAAFSKIMRNQDLILAAKKCRVVTAFRNTLGLPGRLSVRLQPNHPTDDLRGIAASMKHLRATAEGMEKQI